MTCRQNERAQGWQIKPQRQFAPEHTAGFARTSAGDDFDAADMIGMGGMEEGVQRMEGALGGASMQIQSAGRGELAGPKPVPAGIIQSAGLRAD
jgi:hypothetical protein